MTNFYYAILVAIVSVVVAFVATWMLYKKEDVER